MRNAFREKLAMTTFADKFIPPPIKTRSEKLAEKCEFIRNEHLVHFAIHAPTEIPEWFKPEPPPEPEEPTDLKPEVDISHLPEVVQEHIRSWEHDWISPWDYGSDGPTITEYIDLDPKSEDCDPEFTPKVMEFLSEYERKLHPYLKANFDYKRAKKNHPTACKEDRYFRWRWYYAEKMVGTSGQTPKP